MFSRIAIIRPKMRACGAKDLRTHGLQILSSQEPNWHAIT